MESKSVAPWLPRSLRSDRSRLALAFSAILLLAFLLRVIGLGWGLPDQLALGDQPFHPDEHAVYSRGQTLYTAPDAITLGWGGALYFRISFLLGAVASGVAGMIRESEFAVTLLLLRGLNVLLAMATVATVGWLAKHAYGPGVGLTAAALLACFPNHVLSSHYARPDVLMAFLCTGALASATHFAADGRQRVLVLGGVLAGLALSTSAWGVVAFAPIGTAWLVQKADSGLHGNWPRELALLFAILLAGAAGYLIGSFESFIFWDVFEAAFGRTAGMHDTGGFDFPTDLLTTVSFYAFGTIAALLSYAGLVLLLTRRRPVDWIIAAYLLSGYVLLTRVNGEMIRYVLFLAPGVAVSAAVAIDKLSSWPVAARPRARWRRLLVPAAAVALTLQLSLTYVWPMGFEEDPRVQAGTWLIANSPPNSSVGVTQSFYGDESYGPRFPTSHGLEIERLQLRNNFDSSGYLKKDLDFIATSDFAVSHAGGRTAPDFFRRLRESGHYRLRHEVAPFPPPLCIARWLGLERPGDLMYVRLTLYIYQSASARAR